MTDFGITNWDHTIKPNPGCFWHGGEPIPPDAYRVCGECGHCWPTRAAFVADCHAKQLLAVLEDPSYDPYFCPLCVDDW